MPGDHAFPYMKRSYYDQQTAFLFKGTCNDHGCRFTDRQVQPHVLKNCADDGKDLAQILAERTHSEVVQVIGKMIVLYKPAKEEKDRKIILP